MNLRLSGVMGRPRGVFSVISVAACSLGIIWLIGASSKATPPSTGDAPRGGRTSEVTVIGEERLVIPDAEDIAGITVDLYGLHGLPDVDDFVLPREFYPEILEYFERPKLATDVRLVGEIGSLAIRQKTGEVVRLHWHWTGKTRLWFSMYGMRCESGTFLERAKRHPDSIDEGGALDGRLRRIYQECTGENVSAIRLTPQQVEEFVRQQLEEGEPGVGADSR